MTALAEVAATSAAVATTTSRLAKRAALAALLCRLHPTEIAPVVAWLTGELTQRQIGIGWAALRHPPQPAEAASLDITAVEATFDRIKADRGTGSATRRQSELVGLLACATIDEQLFLRRLLGGDLRQGALSGVMIDAVAQAAVVSAAEVRRATMLHGELPAVAALALTDGSPALAAVSLQVGRPVAPMLAQAAASTADALERLGVAVLEWKLDGARVQVHRDGRDVAVFTRSLDEVTARLPELVSVARALPVRAVVLDGEAIAMRPDGIPEPFQVTAARFGRRDGDQHTALRPFFFDLLHLDGNDLLDRPLRERRDLLAELTAVEQRPRSLITGDGAAAHDFYLETVRERHEGVVVKRLDSTYEAGRRGGAWLKVKPVHTLDLVVLGVEWGSGRRSGWLSNLHLGARGPAGFVMLGKTFKGLTDELLRWQTERFLQLADGPTDGYLVTVRPEQVVEVAFDGVQRSPRYPGGVALRFARVVRYRDDKPASEADTVETVQAMYSASPAS